MNPWVSVVMTLHDSHDIVHVGVRSLLDQENAPPWELIVLDDIEGRLPENYFYGIKQALKGSGCVGLRYHVVPQGISFIRKFAMASKMISDSSTVVSFQPDDDYMSSNHLYRAWNEYQKEPYDAMYDRYGHFVDIESGNAMFFDQQDGYGKPYSLCCSISAKAFRKFPIEDGKWPDGYLYRSLGENPNVRIMEDDSWNKNVYLNHGNNAGGGRQRMYADPKPPFTKVDIKDVWMPEFIKEMIGNPLGVTA